MKVQNDYPHPIDKETHCQSTSFPSPPLGKKLRIRKTTLSTGGLSIWMKSMEVLLRNLSLEKTHMWLEYESRVTQSSGATNCTCQSAETTRSRIVDHSVTIVLSNSCDINFKRSLEDEWESTKIVSDHRICLTSKDLEVRFLLVGDNLHADREHSRFIGGPWGPDARKNSLRFEDCLDDYWQADDKLPQLSVANEALVSEDLDRIQRSPREGLSGMTLLVYIYVVKKKKNHPRVWVGPTTLIA